MDETNTTTRAMHAMQRALRQIANSGDCSYYDEKEKPKPCDCPVCVAKAVLETNTDWRFRGRGFERTATNPREQKIVTAWRAYMTGGPADRSDFKLAQVLGEADENGARAYPTVRDWFVATTVVQWLATNVGQSILEAAGYKYDQYDQDRRLREFKDPR